MTSYCFSRPKFPVFVSPIFMSFSFNAARNPTDVLLSWAIYISSINMKNTLNVLFAIFSLGLQLIVLRITPFPFNFIEEFARHSLTFSTTFFFNK